MPRAGAVVKRKLEPDPIYNSRLVTRFINRIMKNGKKTVAQNIVYGALSIIKEKSKNDPLPIFEMAIRNVSPRLEVHPRRVGGATYQVPMEVRGDRREALSLRWIIDSARGRKGPEYHTMAEKLSGEIMDAANNMGNAIKKRNDTHKMAEGNKAFAHFRW